MTARELECLAEMIRATPTDALSLLYQFDRGRAYGLRMAAWEAAAASEGFHNFDDEDECLECLANRLRDMAEGLHPYREARS